MRTPSLWTPLPAQHHRHGKMVELLALHGPSGPHSFTVLLSEAAAMIHGNDARGIVEMSWREFGHFAGIPLDETRARLEELAAEPFSLVEIIECTPMRFRLRIVRWAEWDLIPKDPNAAERKRRERAQDADRDEA